MTPHAGVRDQQPPGQGLRGAATGAHPDIPVDILHAKVKDMTCLGSGVVTGRRPIAEGCDDVTSYAGEWMQFTMYSQALLY